VLDVQSEKISGLTEDDEAILQTLANQIATALRNARAFAQTQEALYEAQKLQRLYTGAAWEQFRTARPSLDYEFRQLALPPLKDVTTPEATAALQQEQTVALTTNGKRARTEAHQTNGPTLVEEAQAEPRKPQGQSALATPLKLRDELIGVLGIQDERSDRRWTEEEIALIEAVSEQMSLAIENARLFEHTQRDAWRNQVISETTARVWASAEIDEVMRAAVAELGDKLKASEVVIRLGAD
jgi:GAF domain-containing protein